MNLSLEGKTAIVCGSTQGIGLSCAIELALLGANCVLISRNEISLQGAIKKLDTSKAQQHKYLIADFSKPAQVKQPFKISRRKMLRIFSLITRADLLQDQ